MELRIWEAHLGRAEPSRRCCSSKRWRTSESELEGAQSLVSFIFFIWEKSMSLTYRNKTLRYCNFGI